MDFRLRAFLAVAKHLSFTRASKEMGVTQPAITKHIQELENMFGVQLLSRQGGKTGLTRHGGILQEYAERIVMEHELLRLEMRLPGEGLQGGLNLVSDFRAAGMVVPELLPEFKEKFPEVKVTLTVLPEIPSSAQNGEELLLVASQDVSGGDSIKILHHEEAAPQAQAFADFLVIFFRRKGLTVNI